MIAPSGACAVVPRKTTKAVTRTEVEVFAASEPSQVASVARIVKNATTRFPNSM